jgi:hypothetical protein
MKQTIYFSCDIEANGPIPGPNSMLSLGASAFTSEGKMLSTFSVNLETLPNAYESTSTMKWWSENQKAYDLTRVNPIDPKLAIEQFVSWVNSLDGKPVFVGYPATYDFMWTHWYIIHFLGEDTDPFSFSGLDIKTFASAVMGTEYRKSTKRNMPKRWFPKDKHTHEALADSIEQGKLFINMLKENMANKKVLK